MKTLIFRISTATLLGAALIAPVTMPAVLKAAEHHDKTYRDEERHDEHQWNSREDRAYRMWAKEKHRKYQNFEKLKAEDQRAYWGWRHEHSDAMLKIDIH